MAGAVIAQLLKNSNLCTAAQMQQLLTVYNNNLASPQTYIIFLLLVSHEEVDNH